MELESVLEQERNGKMRAGEKCLVIGSGLSGISAVACLEYMGAEVTLYDSNEKLTQEDHDFRVSFATLSQQQTNQTL